MTIAIGVVMTDHIVAGRLEDHRLTGPLLRFPEDSNELDALVTVPGGELVEKMAALICTLIDSNCEPGGQAGTVDAIGVAVPGIVRHGVVEESPNLAQIKGMWLADFDAGNGYYCWKFPENEIRFWHGYKDGFSGRVEIQ